MKRIMTRALAASLAFRLNENPTKITGEREIVGDEDFRDHRRYEDEHDDDADHRQPGNPEMYLHALALVFSSDYIVDFHTARLYSNSVPRATRFFAMQWLLHPERGGTGT
jgi:hypothetical protein